MGILCFLDANDDGCIELKMSYFYDCMISFKFESMNDKSLFSENDSEQNLSNTLFLCQLAKFKFSKK